MGFLYFCEGLYAQESDNFKYIVEKLDSKGFLSEKEIAQLEDLIVKILPTPTKLLVESSWKVEYIDMPLGDFFHILLVKGDKRFLMLHIFTRMGNVPSNVSRFLDYPSYSVDKRYHISVIAGRVEFKFVSLNPLFDGSKLLDIAALFPFKQFARVSE